MRLLISLSIILILFLGFGIYTQQQILKTASELQKVVPLIEEKVKARQWENARQAITELVENWNKIQDTWDMFISHHEIDEVELILARALGYIEAQDDVGATAELAALKSQLSHIYRKEIFNLQNVF